VPRAIARSYTPPPAPRAPPSPPLLRALVQDSAEDVRAACEAEPDAARSVFWDHDVEPPLCLAARLGCSPAVLRALLEHGADPSLLDANGRGPLALHRPRPFRNAAEWSEADRILRSACLGDEHKDDARDQSADLLLVDVEGRLPWTRQMQPPRPGQMAMEWFEADRLLHDPCPPEGAALSPFLSLWEGAAVVPLGSGVWA